MLIGGGFPQSVMIPTANLLNPPPVLIGRGFPQSGDDSQQPTYDRPPPVLIGRGFPQSGDDSQQPTSDRPPPVLIGGGFPQSVMIPTANLLNPPPAPNVDGREQRRNDGENKDHKIVKLVYAV